MLDVCIFFSCCSWCILFVCCCGLVGCGSDVVVEFTDLNGIDCGDCGDCGGDGSTCLEEGCGPGAGAPSIQCDYSDDVVCDASMCSIECNS